MQTLFLELFLSAIAGLWVVNDARTRGLGGWAAYWCGFGVFMILPIGLATWLIFRPKRKDGATLNTSNDLFPRAPIPNPQDAFAKDATSSTRSKICDHCGKFYLGKHDKCPHCGAPISN